MLERLISILKEEFDLSEEQKAIHSDTKIQEIIPFSSLNIAILLTSIELEFDKTIEPVALKKCETLGDLIQLIA